MKKQATTIQQVTDSLPVPPPGYSYKVERVTPQVIKVWLCHDDANHSYTNEAVYSIHSYVKKDMAHIPRNSEKMRVSPLCHFSELRNQSRWSLINQPGNALAELL